MSFNKAHFFYVFDGILAERNLGDIPGFELILVYNSQSSGTISVRMINITSIIDVVDDNTGTSPVVGRGPTDIIVSAVPVNPSRSPHRGRDPVPPESGTPVPTAIVEGCPTPWFIREPSPSADREPHPSSAPVGAPVGCDSTGNPNVSIREDISPLPIISQFVFEILQFSRQIPSGHALAHFDVPAFVPSVEAVLGYSHKT